MKSSLRFLLALVLSAGLLTACSTTKDGTEGGPGGMGGAGGDAAGLGRPGGSGSDLYGPGGAGGGLGGPGGRGGPGGLGADGMGGEPEHRITFDFDSALISPEAARVLATNARWIQSSGAREVMVEGHCDERGTRDYNLALGQKRADAVRDYLVSQGIEGGRLKTVSYGKERPLVVGHDEFAWSKNRRAELRLGGR
ncbi:MAG: peptidoglycan-associated lipoprotein Pal [Magnetococcales bacterium]|nr:peptidoglycan-associated lipoprotein Pal [Magnetococcales bacterium]